jgi:hypothetical protein
MIDGVLLPINRPRGKCGRYIRNMPLYIVDPCSFRKSLIRSFSTIPRKQIFTANSHQGVSQQVRHFTGMAPDPKSGDISFFSAP